MLRTKTVRKTGKKISPLSPDTLPSQNQIKPVLEETPKSPVSLQVSEIKKEISTENMLSALHDAELKKAVSKPWLKLERGVRMKFLRAYIEKKTDFTVAERGELFQFLVDALDRRVLNSKSQITYSQEMNEITEINALKITKNASGKYIFKIESPNKTTKKAKRLSGSDED